MMARGVPGRRVRPRDPAALAAGMLWMLEHPAEARAMGAAGRQRVERDFTCERTAQRTLAEYGRLLAARRGAGEAGAG
jgi:glycosyltransferase involved in cell wall biosynthesis